MDAPQYPTVNEDCFIQRWLPKLTSRRRILICRDSSDSDVPPFQPSSKLVLVLPGWSCPIMANTVAIVSLLVIIPAFALFLAFSALTAYVVYLHWIYRHLPGPKRDSFFFGNIPFIEREKEGGKTIFDIFTDQHRVYGPVVLMWAYYNPFTSVSDPEMVRKCLLTLNLPKNPRTYRNISFVFGHRVAGNGVLTEINHEAWQKRREILNPAFHRRYLMNLMSALNSICDDFLAKIDELADGKTTVNMAEEFNRVTLDVIGKVRNNHKGFGSFAQSIMRNRMDTTKRALHHSRIIIRHQSIYIQLRIL